ncbi:hypothetical protein Tco_0091247 [Tanacetum coccineum]
MEPDIENMTISEYLEYEAVKERRLWDDVRSSRRSTTLLCVDVDLFTRIREQDDDSEEDQEEDGDDEDTFDMVGYYGLEDVKRIRKFFNVPDEIDEIVQPVIPEPIHTTPHHLMMIM